MADAENELTVDTIHKAIEALKASDAIIEPVMIDGLPHYTWDQKRSMNDNFAMPAISPPSSPPTQRTRTTSPGSGPMRTRWNVCLITHLCPRGRRKGVAGQ